jgi:RNA polymerase sigma-70 factor, ECF subfamily
MRRAWNDRDEPDRADDGAAVGELYRTYRGMIARRAMRSTCDWDVAEDVAQETLIRAYESRIALQPNRLGGWLMTVCDRICIDRRRREKRERTACRCAELAFASAPASAESSIEDQADRVDYLEAITDLVVRLPGRKREMAILHFFGGMRPAAIAAQLGVKPRTVWTRLYEIRRGIRVQLDLAPIDPVRRPDGEEIARRALIAKWGQQLLASLLTQGANAGSRRTGQ